MKRFRTVVFWGHLATGVICGTVILVMSVTGAVLALKPQILNWIERDVRFVEARSTPRLDPHDLLTAAASTRPGEQPTSLTVDRSPTAAAVVAFASGNVFVDPYSGALLGTGSPRANRFFQSMTTWHRYLGAEGDWRPTGKSLTGISNLAFLGLAVTGLYIWWPRGLTARYLRPIVWFRSGATGRARDFNWHNTIGFWCLPAIVIMTISGAVISYGWANNLVYRATGSPIPAARGGGGRGGGEGRGAVAAPRTETARAGQRLERGEDAASAVFPPRVNDMFARAEEAVPTWSVIALRLGTGDRAPATLTITDGAHWNRFARSTLTVNSQTAEVAQWQPYAESSRGQKLRGWLRFAHTGELGRLPGQLIAGVGCLGGVMLVYTGLALSVRRFWSWAPKKELIHAAAYSQRTQP